MRYPPRAKAPRLSVAELNAMPRTTPTAEAEAAYAASRGRRYPVVDGVPHPRSPWLPTKDHRTIAELLRRVLVDEIATIAPDWMRRAAAQVLLADIDARFPPDDMAVLKRYGLTQPLSMAIVRTGTGQERLTLPGSRDVACTARTGLQPQAFVSIEAQAGEREALVPEAARGMFDGIDAARSAHKRDQAEATVFPARFRGEHGRQPTWGEIGVAIPRLGAWMAQRREAA